MVGRRAAAGFTLVELLVVLLVLALLAAVAAPAFERVLPGVETKAAARALAATLREARSRAIRDNRETVVVIDVAARTYRVGDAGPTERLDEDLRLSLFTAVSERVDESVGRIRFFPDGSATGGRVSVGSEDTGYRVLVDWLTGRIDVVARTRA